MPVPHAVSARARQESKVLVVAISALQLAFVLLAWLLALVPLALMALGAAVFQAVKPAAAKASAVARTET